MSQLLRISVAKKVQLTFNLVHSLPSIRGDVSQIRQIVMNLVINASEAIGDNEGFYLGFLRRCSRGQGTLSLRLRHRPA